MTDQQHYTSADSPLTLKIDAARGWGIPGHVLVALGRSGEDPGTHYGMHVPTARLLAMIDAEDPDAMRAYLRETIPEADSPEDVTESRVDRRYCDPLTEEELEQLRASGRTLGEAWRTFTEGVRSGTFGADR